MKFTEWLDKEKGRAKAVALHFGVTDSAVSQWRDNGVPISKMEALSKFTGGKVSLKEMLTNALMTAKPRAVRVRETA